MSRMDDYLIRPDAGHTAEKIDFAAFHKVQSALTEGRFAIVEHPIAPGVLAAPMHAHSREDEFSILLEGQIGFRIGEEEAVAGPGTVVVKPRGILHTFWNGGDQPARLLEIISPAGFEAYFDELVPILSRRDAHGQPDIGALMALGG